MVGAAGIELAPGASWCSAACRHQAFDNGGGQGVLDQRYRPALVALDDRASAFEADPRPRTSSPLAGIEVMSSEQLGKQVDVRLDHGEHHA